MPMNDGVDVDRERSLGKAWALLIALVTRQPRRVHSPSKATPRFIFFTVSSN